MWRCLTQPSGPSGAPAMPFSELGELSGVPNQPKADPALLPSAPQLKAKSALGAFAAQRVAGLAQPALNLGANALAAGRRGLILPWNASSLCKDVVIWGVSCIKNQIFRTHVQLPTLLAAYKLNMCMRVTLQHILRESLCVL